MGYYKLNTDGTIQSRSKQVDDTWLPLSKLETKENGEYYTYYNEDGTADLEKEMKADMDNLFQSIESSIQAMIDSQAKELGYDDINSISKYFRPSSPYYEQSVKLGDWVDAVWTKAFELQATMTEVPTVESVLEQLPKFE
jgi:hypothetical protein